MEPDILDRKLPTTNYYPKGWLQKLDIIGMVLAPISFSLPFFFGTILLYQTAGSNGTGYYIDALASFFVALWILIILGSLFEGFLKSYINHQATRDEVNRFRIGYSIFILGSLAFFFMILVYLLYGPKS